MTLVLVFAIALLLAVLLSQWASRTLLSTSLLFLAAGVVAGPAVLDVVRLEATDPAVRMLVELALFAVLFTDGMLVGLREVREAWRLPGRALLLGLPLTMAGTAALAHVLTGLPWVESFLLGAVLSPTDPVLAGAIVGREEVPGRLRFLLNVESGTNDGLALPVVLLLLAAAGGRDVDLATLLGEAAAGAALGVAVPWVVLRLESLPPLAAHALYQPLLSFTIGALVFSIASLTHANEFLAAFAAGVTVASTSEEAREEFPRFGELLAELLKLAALLVFGLLVTASTFDDFTVGTWVLVVLVLLAVRPVAVLLSLLGSRVPRDERIAASWFGPKGFASVVYGILVLEAGIDRSGFLFHVVAAVITLSIVLHSSTDVLVARWFRRTSGDGAEGEERR